MFGNIINKLKKSVDETEQIADHFYAQVMDEISDGYKDKGLVGKAIAQSDGNEAKFDAIYIKLRAKALQNVFLRNSQAQKEQQYMDEIEQNELNISIKKRYLEGHFHHMFNQEIHAKGYTIPFLANNNTFRRNGQTYKGEIDYKTMHYILVDKQKRVMDKFKFQEK